MVYKRFTEFSLGSPIIRELEDYAKDNSKITSITPSIDVIVPLSSAKLKGANNISLKTPGHNSAINSKEASNVIIKELEKISSQLN